MNIGNNIPEYEVSQFNKTFKQVIENNFDYIKIKGEISELKNASSGHIYLTLKDELSVLNATLWNQKKNYLKFLPEVGMKVVVTGKVSTYAKSISTYSINIDNIELAGEGALLKLIEERKIKLNKIGIFNNENKKNIPFLPAKIGVITSPTGSVIHDIINRVKDRFPTKIDIWPVTVQGTTAAHEIIRAIKGFNNESYIEHPEVIIIARGGGSTEDLMPFNDEDLAISVYESSIPIISAIGHETDTTIIDYCSDIRASTPTAAAELAVPVRVELIKTILNISNKLDYLQENNYNNIKFNLDNLSKFLKAPNLIINLYKDKINFVELNFFNQLKKILNNKLNQFNSLSKLLRFPQNYISNTNSNLNNTSRNLERIFFDNKNFKKKELNKFSRLLQSNSLYANLRKGYSIVKKSNNIINQSNSINQNDSLNIQFLDKSINIKIKKIN